MKAIKKAVNGTTTTKTTLDPKSRDLITKQFKENQKYKDSTYESNTKINLEKKIKDLALKAQQLQQKKNEERTSKLYERPRNKNGGTVKAKDGKWIQKATASIKRRGTEGKCTPITKPGCTGRAKALAKTFKKIAKSNKKK